MARRIGGQGRRARSSAGAHPKPPPTRLGRLIASMASALRTVKGAIVGAGAIALALAAIWALIPHPKPVEVHFVSVDLSPAPVPLSQFRPVEGKFAPTALSWGHESVPAAMVAFVQNGPASTVSRLRVRSLTELATTSPSPGATDSSTTSTPPTTDATTPSTTPSSTSGSATATSSTSTGAGGPHKPPKLPSAYVSDVLRQLRAAGYKRPWVILPAMGHTTDPDGKLMPPREAAARVIKALSHVRARAGGGKEEPVGVVLNVRMRFVNARDVPVWIYWEMAGAGGKTNSLSDDWLASIPAYVLHATEDVDSGTFKLWVPLPKEKGDYVVSLYARTTNNELPEDSISTSSFH